MSSQSENESDDTEPRQVLLTKNGWAREFEVAPDTVAKRFNAAMLDPAGKNKNGYPVYGLKGAAMAILGIMTERRKGWEEIDPTTLHPAERALLAKGKLDESRKKAEDLKIDKLEGVLVSAEDCRRQKALMATAILQTIDTLPSALQSCDLSHDVIGRVKSICDAEHHKFTDYAV